MALRNAVHRRQHKERGQLASRKKFGLLEKHSDYVLRARDHSSKKERLKRLREKAATRNADEFYFGMIRSRTEKGVHIAARGDAEELDHDLVQLLKTQDAGYIQAQIRAESKRVDKLKERIAPLVPRMRAEWLEARDGRIEALRKAGLLPEDGLPRDEGVVGLMGKKTVWCEGGRDEVRKYKPPVEATSAPSTSRTAQKLRATDDSDDEDMDDSEEEAADARAQGGSTKQFEKHASSLLVELRTRQARLSTLSEASQKLSTVRALMGTKGGSARKMDAKGAEAKDAIAKGAKLSKHGLAMPGAESDDEDEETGKKKKSIWKWSRDRKK